MTGPDTRPASAPRRLAVILSDLGGGTGDHLLSMLPLWRQAGWAVRLQSEAPLTSRLAVDAPIEYLGRRSRLLRFPVAQLVTLGRIAAGLRRHPADLVHTYFFWSIVYGRALKAAGRIRCLVENREDEGFSWGRMEYAMLRRSQALPDRVICVSEAVRQVALRGEGLDPGRVVVVPNGVPLAVPAPERARAAREELGYSDRDLVVGMVSNLNRAIKGVPYFLDAVPLIASAVPEARFVIFGTGRDEPSLRAAATERGLDRVLQFAGFRTDIERFYPALDVSVLTSLSEGLSIAVLESMNHGVPVVATRVGGNPELVVEGETGFLVPPRNPEAFAERVTALLRDPVLRRRLGAAGRRRVEERFDIRAAASRYLAVYEEVLAQKMV